MRASGSIRFAAVILTFLSVAMSPWPTAAYLLPEDLTQLSIDALANIEVSLASRKPQKLSDSAAAIFVITHEDIRRSGVTTIPEALRMVPGLEVARIDANKWAISARGFNGRFAAKLLVLMDGRSVYDPLFSGVYWDQQDTLMEDIEKIEVIRGPGATLWGANAVNGVINIITKNAQQTTDGLATAGGGNNESFGSFRYGSRTADTSYRIWGKYRNQGSFVTASGHDTSDSWETSRGGFRVDSTISEKNTLTLQGDYSHAHYANESEGPLLTAPYTRPLKGGSANTANLLARWGHSFSASSDLSFQAYYDWMHASAPDNREIRNTVDLDLQHSFEIGKRNDIVWGLGYRRVDGDFKGDFNYAFDPAVRRDDLFSGFIQNNLLLIPDRLHMIFGSKVEHNDYTGFEVQPSVRALWTPDKNQTIWGSISRAVRTPSWGETNGQTITNVVPPFTPTNPSPFPAAISLQGDHHFGSEKLIAYELGYRFHPRDIFSLDITGFYNVYSDLRSARLGSPSLVISPSPYVVVPLMGENGMKGTTYGCELAVDWKPVSRWRIQGSYTYLHVALHHDTDSAVVLETSDGASPHHQFSLRSSIDISETVELDGWLRYAGRISSLDVPSYLTLDLRLGWQPVPAMELAVVCQNLFHKRHAEFSSMDVQASRIEVPRSFYLKGTWKF